MKLITTIIIILLNSLVFAQTKLDSLVFNKVNEYRVSMNIEPLKWDTTCFKASEIHTKYLLKTGKVGHTEDSLKDPKDRMRVFDTKGKWTIINEVALSTKSTNIKNTDSIIEKLATIIVGGWKFSEEHNNILLDKDSKSIPGKIPTKFAGVSCVVVSNPSGFKDIKNYRVVSTMLIVGGTYRKL